MSLDKHRVPGSVDKHLPDFRGDSVEIDSQTVGGTGPVTGIFGDEGEYVNIGSYPIPGTFSTTSTTYTAAPTNTNGELPMVNISRANLTGFSGLYLSLNAELYGSATTKFARTGTFNNPLSDTEVSGGAGLFFSSLGELDSPNNERLIVEFKSSDGSTASIRNVTVDVWGKIA